MSLFQFIFWHLEEFFFNLGNRASVEIDPLSTSNLKKLIMFQKGVNSQPNHILL